MKLALALFFSFIGIAFADLLEKPVTCTSQDYAVLNSILTRKTIIEGVEHKNDLLSMLRQEMGPKCVKMVPVRPVYGIPGDKTTTYVVSSGPARYMIFDSKSVEDPSKNGVRIIKRN